MAQLQSMVTARFRIRLPEDAWISAVSRQFSNAEFRLLTGFKTDDGAIELGEVVGPDPSTISEAIRTHPSIIDHRVLDRTETRSLARYRTTDAELYEFVAGSSVAPTFPITVRGGWFEYDLTATRGEFDGFRSGLERTGLSFELISIVRHVDETDLLTARQREVLERALREGYLDVPRQCTLEELAVGLNADKSTVSEILRRGDAKVITWYLTGPGSHRK